MQKTTIGQRSTVFYSWSNILKVISSNEKKLLRHYIATINELTTETFFNFKPTWIDRSKYLKININCFKNLHDEYRQLGAIKLSTGPHNKTLYSLPDNHPRSSEEWVGVKGGYLALPRSILKGLLSTLDDNELRVFFILKRLHDINSKLQNTSLGIMTWPKLLRDHHVKINQGTLRKCLKSLEEKGIIFIAEPICPSDRFQNRFVFTVVSENEKLESRLIADSIDKNDTSNEEIKVQNQENSAHIKEINTEIKYLNQKFSDFDFCDLNKLKRPLEKKTINYLIKSGIANKETIQQSVRNISRFYKAHPDQLSNPVGFLFRHLTQFKCVYVEPEWFIDELNHKRKAEESFSGVSLEEVAQIISRSSPDQHIELGDFDFSFKGMLDLIERETA